jgi:hypothetical protein
VGAVPVAAALLALAVILLRHPVPATELAAAVPADR